jgi:hypothetical protein
MLAALVFLAAGDQAAGDYRGDSDGLTAHDR